MAKKHVDGDTIIIKKYANRRLYNTGTSSYITLDDLATMTREGSDFKVVDAKSGDDITHSILTQIIMEAEASGTQMLPVSFLRDLISMYGNSVQTMMPSYLEAAMMNFRANQTKFASAFEKRLGDNPFAKMAETNLAMMKAAATAFIPKVGGAGEAAGDQNEQPSSQADVDQPGAGESVQTDDLAALRAQMEAMQKKLDKLG